MMMLKSKLFALMEEKQAKELKEIQGEQKEIAWGSQIRSMLSFDMLVGRLEIFPMLLLFAPSIWKRRLPSRRLVD